MDRRGQVIHMLLACISFNPEILEQALSIPSVWSAFLFCPGSAYQRPHIPWSQNRKSKAKSGNACKLIRTP